MNETELIQAWNNSWKRIVYAQLAPTFLLISTVALLQFGLADASFAVRAAAAFILLASGILGALAEFAAAAEAQRIAADLPKVQSIAKWLPVVKFVTPAIFIAIFVAIIAALFLGA